MSSPLSRHLLRRGARLNSMRTTVVAGAVNVHIVNHRAVVHIVNVGDVHIVDCAVVVEVMAAPVSTPVADAGVTEAVVNATVESDGRSPVAGVPVVQSGGKSPVARRPQEADLGRHHPCSRHPVVSARAVSPITRCPDVSWSRTERLRVHGQRGRADCYAKRTPQPMS